MPMEVSSSTDESRDLEVAIGQIWKEVFHRDEIGRDDNFFELGGNSLLGMDVTELMASRLDIHIPVLVLFQHPTIHELSSIICTSGEFS